MGPVDEALASPVHEADPREASALERRVADLYRRMGHMVYRRALSLLGDTEEAMEVTQDTFLTLVREPGLGRTEAATFTLLYQVATCRAVDRLRRRARWTGRLATLVAPDLSPSGGEPSHTREMARVEAAQDLALLTRGESPEVLTVASLYYVEGYTEEEVARALDLSRKTVGKMLVRFAERARKRSARLEGGRR